MGDTKYVSSININEVVYQIKDKEARNSINILENDLNSKIDKTQDSNIDAILKFNNGIKIGEASITYNASTDTVEFR